MLSSLLAPSIASQLLPPPKPPDTLISLQSTLRSNSPGLINQVQDSSSFKEVTMRGIIANMDQASSKGSHTGFRIQENIDTQEPISSYKSKLLQLSAHFYFQTWLKNLDYYPEDGIGKDIATES
ncbi:hypothetical protein Salat_0634800 [Sesamum alatum]|uniref:Uncharacterized protein n=1 Tax=Sesamum alatum TaxID=300844 RepID=A0AAE2CU89_9LAMI|nr:hypothetical protein Salat_0634800 [Sesamum alatum]